MNPLEYCSVQCPWCWELIELTVDCSIPHQEYVEDCPVCCRPMDLVVEITARGQDGLTIRCERAD